MHTLELPWWYLCLRHTHIARQRLLQSTLSRTTSPFIGLLLWQTCVCTYANICAFLSSCGIGALLFVLQPLEAVLILSCGLSFSLSLSLSVSLRDWVFIIRKEKDLLCFALLRIRGKDPFA